LRQQVIEDAESIGPRRRRCESFGQRCSPAPEDLVWFDRRRREGAGGKAEESAGAERSDLHTDAGLVSVVANHRRARVQPAQHARERTRGAGGSLHRGQLDRISQADDEGEKP
jgi:hypothetical protein